MEKNYTVDDILAEVKSKKGGSFSPSPSVERLSPYDLGDDGNPAAPLQPSFTVKGLDLAEFEIPESVNMASSSARPEGMPVERQPLRENTQRPSAETRPHREEGRARPTMTEKWEKGTESQSQPFIIKSGDIQDTQVIPDLDKKLSAGMSGKIKRQLLYNMDDVATATVDIPSENKVVPPSPTLAEEEPEKKGFGRLFQSKKAKLKSDEPDLSKLEIDDFTTMDDAPSIKKDIKSIRANLTVRLITTAICFGILLYLALSVNLPLPLPQIIFPELNMQFFTLANLCVMIIATLACNSVVGGGLISFLTLKADGDSPMALATLATIANGVALAVFPKYLENGKAQMFFVIAALGLIFNTIGKLHIIKRVDRNFEIIASDKEKISILSTRESAVLGGIAGLAADVDAAMAYGVKTEFPTNFLEISYVEDYAESISKLVTPLFFGFSFLMSCISYLLFNRDVMATLTAFNAMVCITSPLTATMVGNLPLYRATAKLNKEGSAISGYTAVEQMDGVKAIALNATELFPAGCVELHGIKTFAQGRIDQAILDAASVMCSVEGLLTDIFMQIIGSNVSMLKRIDTLVYEDGMGISAWVDGKRVLIGNRELMRHHGIDTPSDDYEQKFVGGGRDILYLANSGEVTAMFVLSYKANEEIARQLERFAHLDTHLVIYTTDPNITIAKVASSYEYPSDLIRLVPANLHTEYRSLTEARPTASAQMVSVGGPVSRMHAISAAITVKSSIQMGMMLQLFGMVFGYVVITYLAFMGTVSAMGFFQLMIYQLFWAAAVIIVPNIRKL